MYVYIYIHLSLNFDWDSHEMCELPLILCLPICQFRFLFNVSAFHGYIGYFNELNVTQTKIKRPIHSHKINTISKCCWRGAKGKLIVDGLETINRWMIYGWFESVSGWIARCYATHHRIASNIYKCPVENLQSNDGYSTQWNRTEIKNDFFFRVEQIESNLTIKLMLTQNTPTTLKKC